MRRRFFIRPDDLDGDKAVLRGPEAHHLQHVLRLRVSDRIQLFDGSGTAYEAVIDRLEKGKAEMTLLTRHQPPHDQVALHVGQALLTGKKMDFLLQKATELGAAALHPFVSAHCSAKTRSEQRGDRWRRIVLEACKQCGRSTPLYCPPLAEYGEMLSMPQPFGLKLLFWEKEKHRGLRETLTAQPAGPVLALIGPEGGFTEAEVEQAAAAGFWPVSLGTRILRAETASLAIISILQFLLGNLDNRKYSL